MMKKIALGFIALVVLAGIGSALGGGSDATDPGSSGGDTTSEGGGNPGGDSTADRVAIGSAAQDGSFEFTVQDFDCSKSTIGSGFSKATANGVYCLVSLTVENIGTESQTLDATNQYLYDSQGRKFETSSDAILALPESNAFLNQLNPGIKVDAQIVFDIPTDATPTYLELHDSVFSGGVEVAV